MALIAIASDKGAPGVTTAALALAAVWPRPVLLAECDPAGGDLVYRFPAVGGGHLDPRRGVLSLAVVARRGMQPQQVWEHVQKLHGGLDVLAGVTNAEQGAGLSLLWGPIGKALASMPQADVIADCGRLGADGPLYDLLAEATTVVLVSKVHVADVIRLRDRATAFAAAAQSRGRRNFGVGVVVVADHKKFRASLGEVQHVLGQANAPATVLGGIAHDTKGADLLNGEWGGNLDRTMLIKTAREVARQLVQGLPPIGNPAEPGPAVPAHAQPQPEHPQPAFPRPAPRGARPVTGPQPATGPQPVTGPQPATGPHPGWSSGIPQPAVARYTEPQPAHPALAPAVPTPAQHNQAQRSPADLAAVTLSAPTVSDDAPRTTFSRVRGRPGRHQAEPGQASNGELPADQTSSSPARHAHGGNRQEAGDRHGSVFSRPPMAPLSTSDAQAPAGLAEQEDAEDAGWGATPWDRQGPAGSLGSRRSGGG
jgi:MinD-like ATPase involved in chromosome partitioning or flagellar assembly